MRILTMFDSWTKCHPYLSGALRLLVAASLIAGMVYWFVPHFVEALTVDGPGGEGTGYLWEPRWTSCGLKVSHADDSTRFWNMTAALSIEISVPPHLVNQTLYYASTGQHVHWSLSPGSAATCGRAAVLQSLSAIQ